MRAVSPIAPGVQQDGGDPRQPHGKDEEALSGPRMRAAHDIGVLDLETEVELTRPVGPGKLLGVGVVDVPVVFVAVHVEHGDVTTVAGGLEPPAIQA